jgi:hypothetical protein
MLNFYNNLHLIVLHFQKKKMNAKNSQDDLIENSCDYMDGNLPSPDQSLHAITSEFGFMDIFRSPFFILSCILALNIHQVVTSQIQVSSSSPLPMMLLVVTLRMRVVKKKESRYKVWSDIFSLFSKYLNTQHQEQIFSSKQCVLPFLIFHCLLLLLPWSTQTCYSRHNFHSLWC